MLSIRCSNDIQNEIELESLVKKTNVLDMNSNINNIDDEVKNEEENIKDIIKRTKLIDLNQNLGRPSDYNDFSYKNISQTKLCRIKMPYINHNRNLFCNSDMDLIDVFILNESDSNIVLQVVENLHSRVVHVQKLMVDLKTIISKEMAIYMIPSKIVDESGMPTITIYSKPKDCLDNEFKRLCEQAMEAASDFIISREYIHHLTSLIKEFVFEDSKLMPFCSQIKLLIELFNISDKEYLNIHEFFSFLRKVEYVYGNTILDLVGTISNRIVLARMQCTLSSSYILKNNVFLKYEIHTKMDLCNRYLKDQIPLEGPHHMIVYSNNGDDLISKLSDVINSIICDASKDEINEYNINKIQKSGIGLLKSSLVDFYEITILNKKYVIKKFDLVEMLRLPSGLSTTYLNNNDNFVSLGYMGVIYHNDDMHNKSLRDYFFISVDEQFGKCLNTDDFNLFRNNELQSIYFILDLLNILDNLCSHKIRLLGSKIIFGVDDSNKKRWRFRLDDIEKFIYIKDDEPIHNPKHIKKGDVFENSEFLIEVIDGISKVLKIRSTLNFFKDLRRYAEGLELFKY